MKKVLFSLSLIASLFVNQNGFTKNEYTTYNKSVEVGDCKKQEPCLTVAISYPKFDKKFPQAEKINKYLLDKTLALFEPEKITSKTIDEAIEKEKKEYQKIYAEDKSMTGMGWSYRVKTDILYKSDKYLTLKVDMDTFTGGAHPNYHTTYTTFDLKTGNTLKLKDLDKDFTKTTKLGEKKLRENMKIPNNEKLNDFGYWFPDNKFYLNENFGITDKNVIFFYNTYEVSPYAMGTFEIVLDKKLFKNLK
ncbi:MAG: DUF4163 domain-containing protein [Candidatus Sericytochromatia bacterium]